MPAGDKGQSTEDGRRFLQISDLRRLRNLQFAAKLVVEGYFHGKHRSPFHDFASEFADYRPYTPGDEIRAIDWRAYAKTDRFYIKLFRKETDMSCYLLVDTSNSMGYRGDHGDRDLSKLEYAGFLAASLAYLITRQGDKASLALCGSGLQAFVPAGGSPRHLQQILVALERAKPAGETRLAGSLKSLFGAIKRKGLLVVISDFLDDTEEIYSALGMFAHKGFSILLIQVMTSAELDLPDIGSALFQDMESSAFAAVEPDAIRVAYQAEIRAFLHAMETNAKARRMHYMLTTTSKPYYEALETYLTVRSR